MTFLRGVMFANVLKISKFMRLSGFLFFLYEIILYFCTRIL